eukprot:5385279-Alexandrium_andersonii.AAC.1
MQAQRALPAAQFHWRLRRARARACARLACPRSCGTLACVYRAAHVPAQSRPALMQHMCQHT